MADDNQDLQAKMAAWQQLAGNQQIGPDNSNLPDVGYIPDQQNILQQLGNIPQAAVLNNLQQEQASSDLNKQINGSVPSNYQSPAQLAQMNNLTNSVTGGSLTSGLGAPQMAQRMVNLESSPPVKQWSTDTIKSLADKAKEIMQRPTIPVQDKMMTLQRLKSALKAAKVQGVKVPEE